MDGFNKMNKKIKSLIFTAISIPLILVIFYFVGSFISSLYVGFYSPNTPSVVVNTFKILTGFGLFIILGFIIVVCGDFYRWFYKLLGKY